MWQTFQEMFVTSLDEKLMKTRENIIYLGRIKQAHLQHHQMHSTVTPTSVRRVQFDEKDAT